MDIYLGIGDMPIYNFDKVLKTNNMSYLVVGWNERTEITPPEETIERWNEIYNEYCKRTANNEALNYYTLSCEVGYFEMRYVVIANLIYGLTDANKHDFGKEINAWGIPFNSKGSIEPQIEVLERHIRIAKQNLLIKTRKLKELKGDEDGEEKETSFLKQCIIIQEQLGVKIDIKTDSIEYFLTAIERLKEKLEQQKKVQHG